MVLDMSDGDLVAAKGIHSYRITRDIMDHEQLENGHVYLQ